MLSAKAGELSVTGSAKATYNATSGNKQIMVLVFQTNYHSLLQVKWTMVHMVIHMALDPTDVGTAVQR